MYRSFTRFFLLFCLFLMYVSPVLAYEQVDMSLPSGNDILVTKYHAVTDGEGVSLIMWVPSEHGIRPEMGETALSIADEGFDLWLLNLHESYMVPPGKKSINEFSVENIYELMRIASEKGYKDIILTASGRGAILALKAGRLWQLKHPTDHTFPGYIFLHPHLIEGSVEIGEDASYLPVARSVNKPVYILQPEYSTKYLRKEQIKKQLESGGASVKLDELAGITAGFHARPNDDLSSDDLAMREKMGEKYRQAYQYLRSGKQPTQAARLAPAKQDRPEQKPRLPSLYAYHGKPESPRLQLTDLHGKQHDIRDYKGKVVLINFWASWCGPCVVEMPSLNRLVKKMKGKDFVLLTVDIQESPDRIEKFFVELELEPDFPVLMDTDGQVSRDWKVYAYPSNYLLDTSGKIRYGYRGALEWDSEEVVEVIESLLLQ